MPNNSLIIINAIIISFIPFFLISSPFLSDISICFIALSGLYVIFKEKKYKYLNNIYVKFFFIWCLYLLFTSIISDAIIHSFESSLFYFRFGLFVISIWVFLDIKPKILIYLKLSFIFCFIILFFDSIYQFVNSYNIIGIPASSISTTRISSFFADELILGSYISRLLPIFLCLVFIKVNKTSIFIGLTALVMSDIIVYLSGERTAFFYIIISSIMMIIICNNLKLYRILAIFLSIILIFILSLNSNSLSNRMFLQTYNQIINQDIQNEEINISTNKIKIFSGKHEALYKSSIKMFQKNIFFGIGPKSFRIKCNSKDYKVSNGCSTHPHNIYFQLLAETGIIGFLFIFSVFLFIVLLLFKQFIRNFKKQHFLTDPQLFLLIAIFLSLLPLVPGPNFFHNWMNIIYYFQLGILLHLTYKENIIND